MAMLLAVCFVAYSCSSDDDENEPEYPVVTDSKYYVAPDWDESIVYVPGLIFHDEFIPGVRVVEKLVDYPHMSHIGALWEKEEWTSAL